MKTQTTDQWKYRKTITKKQREEDAGIYALAAAIVKQAVDEYRDADRLSKGEIKHSSIMYGDPEFRKQEIIRFFKSPWYGILCDIDPNIILRKLGAIE